MKKGIEREYDYKDDGIILRKRKGHLTLDEIQDTLTETEGCDEIFFIQVRTGIWDDQSEYAIPASDDYVKCYSYTAIQRLFGGKA